MPYTLHERSLRANGEGGVAVMASIDKYIEYLEHTKEKKKYNENNPDSLINEP